MTLRMVVLLVGTAVVGGCYSPELIDHGPAQPTGDLRKLLIDTVQEFGGIAETPDLKSLPSLDVQAQAPRPEERLVRVRRQPDGSTSLSLDGTADDLRADHEKIKSFLTKVYGPPTLVDKGYTMPEAYWTVPTDYPETVVEIRLSEGASSMQIARRPKGG